MATFTLTNSAGDIDSALQKVVSATTTPTDGSPLMVTSGGVKAYVDTQDTVLETSIVAVEADVAALQAKVNSLNTFATLTLPTTAYSDSRTVTGWVESDPNGYINYNNNGTFSLNINTLAKTGKYLATLVLTAFDADGGSDAHSLQFYMNGVLARTIPLNNAQNTNGGVRFISWDIENNQDWYVRMFESPTNTVTTLSNTSITINKYV
tara:strand:- start:798 stop:1421 length:624 start_codon:yes stop_codon:yes gene_type:complete